MPKLDSGLPLPINPTETFRLFTGIEVPDIITFVVGEKWLNRPNLYPRQATLLKIIFLRDDLFTEYDNAVIDEWERQYQTTGKSGLVPHVRERITELKAKGHKWFREVLLVLGRRAGKGYVTAVALAYVQWNFMAKGDPQGYYGVDRDKKLVALIFAGKREQAKANVFGDLVSVITGSTCFAPYISQSHTEKLSIYAPHDFIRMRKMRAKGIRTERDMASFEILPKESTPMAGRGPASFALAFDEMAHVVASGANRGADEVYGASKPSLDQFGKDSFIIEPSSPWAQSGQFYENWQRAVTLDEQTGKPMDPSFLGIQLASWDIYVDWERAYFLPLLPPDFEGDLGEYRETPQPSFQPLKGAIQVYDEAMMLEERADPEKFAVERRSQWATALDAYLNPDKVDAIFQPWLDRPARYGPPHLAMQQRGLIAMHNYKGHADPSKVNDKFGIALGHTEWDEEGRAHCVLDLLHHFDPADFENHIIDYETVDEWIWENIILAFFPDEFTFDQYNSTSSMQKLQKRIRNQRGLPRQVSVFEKTTTAQYDWQVKENAKAAINLGLVHAPYYEQLELELKFLQLTKNKRVDHPSSGPVQSKDVADCAMEVVHHLIGEQTRNFINGDLTNLRPAGVSLLPGGRPFAQAEPAVFDQLKAFGRGRAAGGAPRSTSFARGRRR